jgi:CBS domain-containing protein
MRAGAPAGKLGIAMTEHPAQAPAEHPAQARAEQVAQDPGSYLFPRIEHARVADAMRHGVLSCTADASLRAAARTMTLHHIHTVVVNDPGSGALVGVVSDADLLGGLLDGGAPDRTVGELAGGGVVTLSSEQPLAEAVGSMRARGADHAVVVDAHSGRPTGMLSLLDVLGVFAWGEA